MIHAEVVRQSLYLKMGEKELMNDDVQAGVITHRGNYRDNSWMILRLCRSIRKRTKGRPSNKIVVYFETAPSEYVCIVEVGFPILKMVYVFFNIL